MSQDVAAGHRSGGADSPYRPGYEVAAERILEAIAHAGLRPGDHLGTESELAKTLATSRTVTREAVKILSALGRVTVRKGSGVYVAEPSGPLAQGPWMLFLPAEPGQVQMLFELRRNLESEAARLAAARATPLQVRAVREAAQESEDAAERNDFASFRRADESFHRAVGAASGNLFFESLVGTITHLKRQVLTIGLHGTRSGSLAVAAGQHVTIAVAIANGDQEAAATAMAHHIDEALSQFRSQLQARMAQTPDNGGEDDVEDR